ncbi:MAG: BatD family protein [Ignavibacteriales bacterium]|nr:BatD family protein [Ignavibacteriales bacterium]
MIEKKKIFFIILITFIINYNLAAQSFTASVNSTSVGSNEPFEISFQFNGDEINSLRNFHAPDFMNFKVISGPNQSTSMQIINGSVSASLSYSFYVTASALGNFTIGSASIDYKGKTYKTEPIKINVIKGTAPQSQQQQKQQQNNAQVNTKNIAENVFIKAFADRQKVYKGEQVTVTYKLYTRLDISSPQISKLPQYQGFWAEEIESPNRIFFTTEVVNGKQYRVATLKKAALFPTQTGQLSVTPFELTIPVVIPKQRRRGDIFDEFFNDPFFNQGQTVDYKATSNTLRVDVLPLPSSNIPASFHGAVGDFSFKASVDKNNVKMNEPFTLKLFVSGTGNISLLDLPEITLPAGLEKYEPKTNDQINRSGRISGQKVVEYLIVPRAMGKKEIAPIEFSYFNPSNNKYYTVSSQTFNLNVEKGDGTYGEGVAGFNKEDVKLLGEDIRFIKTTSDDLVKKGDYTYLKFWFWAITLLPLIAFVGLIAWKKREDELSGNVQLMKFHRAEKIARNRLKTAKKSFDTHNQQVFYSDISQALFGYLEDKLKIPKADFSIDRAIEALRDNNISEEFVAEVRNSVETCEFARFAPQSDGQATMQEMYERASKIIIEFEKNLVTKNKLK